ncbi:hypothetical protein M8J76_012861 [Diaphorina citri]|nr:hypothetical protein M8J75_000812 [Diaphorina citri]KAI5745624.1 hypothetical protein M8J76_012861 [Diaphorina citri]KAI5751793.1 hypothetical protein M8J77_010905 [Diaphorina citri]
MVKDFKVGKLQRKHPHPQWYNSHKHFILQRRNVTEKWRHFREVLPAFATNGANIRSVLYELWRTSCGVQKNANIHHDDAEMVNGGKTGNECRGN